ncbi:hypothetical protein DMH17_11660 [Raoultella planticola]|nr:hypothetical protein [Raoultella planticola]
MRHVWRSTAPSPYLSKGPVSEGSALRAGRYCRRFDERADGVESHVEDTLIAGAGLCDRHAVSFVASNARPCVQWLIDQVCCLILRPGQRRTELPPDP